MTQPTVRPMRGETKRELPIWDDNALSRLLGACDGYAHVLVNIRLAIGRLNDQYAPSIHPRHVRKLERRNAILKPLRELDASVEADLRRCQAAYEKERARAQSEKR
jgi:hypothetical protein